MGEDYNKYFLDDFSYEVLECYLKYGYGDAKVYQTDFFMIYDDEMACLTLNEYYEKATEARQEVRS